MQIFNSKWKGAYFCLSIFFKSVLGTRYKICYSIWLLFLKSSQDYVVMISHFGQKKSNKSPDLSEYIGQNAPLNNEFINCKENLLKCIEFVHSGLYLISWLRWLISFCYVNRYKICPFTTTVSSKITRHIRYLFSN